MNGTPHTVISLPIQLGKHIGGEDTPFGNAPNGCGLYYVSNDQLLNGLVLGDASGAANRLHVGALFVA